MNIDHREGLSIKLSGPGKAKLQSLKGTDGVTWRYIAMPTNQSYSNFAIWLPDNITEESAQRLVDALNSLEIGSSPEIEREKAHIDREADETPF